jgi:hypothetical protein
MTRDEHRVHAEQAIAASIGHRQRWDELPLGTAESDAAMDIAWWELKRAEVHSLLALGGPGVTR